MSKAEKKTAKPRQRKANSYKFPDKLPAGEVIKDVKKKEWTLGSSIGKGGFGEIYCGSSKEAVSKGNNYPYVVKIEPHENGPLFVENNFYLRVAKPEDVEAWKKQSGIKILGMPAFHGFGSHEYNNKKYRFLVIERYGKDLWTAFVEGGRTFSFETVCRYAVQIIDVLEYIHSRGYVHLDVKGANLLFGLKKGTEKNIYLVDFGLACKYTTLAEFKKDPKKTHNGTIEYTSRDMHMGVATRRGDMEVLGFNLLQWVVSKLPWEDSISSPVQVQEKKQELMSDVSSYVKKHFSSLPQGLISFLNYVVKLKHDQAPDYDLCRGFFKKGLEKPALTPRRSSVRAASRRSEILRSPAEVSDKEESERTSTKRKSIAVEDEPEKANGGVGASKRGRSKVVEGQEAAKGRRRKKVEEKVEVVEDESEEINGEVGSTKRGRSKVAEGQEFVKGGRRKKVEEVDEVVEDDSEEINGEVEGSTRGRSKVAEGQEAVKERRTKKVEEEVNEVIEEDDDEDDIIGPTDEEDSDAEESPKSSKRMKGAVRKKSGKDDKKKFNWRDAPAVVPPSLSKRIMRKRTPVKPANRK
ncbi:hypothetical protein AAG570_003403 [Ranatra chinensis]|uniref:non-specific serine/threonine protein kinase n=1 Tax=Ranatra chinensis TaxID=642074 RepID=A0ABD0Y3M3_9HEMI